MGAANLHLALHTAYSLQLIGTKQLFNSTRGNQSASLEFLVTKGGMLGLV